MDIRNQEIKQYIRKGCRAHLVGIGGVSMRPLGVVLQETFLRLLTRPAPGLTADNAQAWLYRVARNLCMDILRRPGEEYTHSAPIVPDEYAYLELISPLSLQEQEIITLKIVGNLSHREIAAVLHTTPAAAQKRYERAIQKLREMEESK